MHKRVKAVKICSSISYEILTDALFMQNSPGIKARSPLYWRVWANYLIKPENLNGDYRIINRINSSFLTTKLIGCCGKKLECFEPIRTTKKNKKAPLKRVNSVCHGIVVHCKIFFRNSSRRFIQYIPLPISESCDKFSWVVYLKF